MEHLNADECMALASAAYSTLMGIENYEKWRDLKKTMKFSTEQEFVKWLLIVAERAAASDRDRDMGVESATSDRDQDIGVESATSDRDQDIGVESATSDRDQDIAVESATSHRDQDIGVESATSLRDQDMGVESASTKPMPTRTPTDDSPAMESSEESEIPGCSRFIQNSDDHVTLDHFNDMLDSDSEDSSGDDEEYMCRLCNHCVGTRANMLQHYKASHQVEYKAWVKCKRCQYEALDYEEMAQHQLQVHGNVAGIDGDDDNDQQEPLPNKKQRLHTNQSPPEQYRCAWCDYTTDSHTYFFTHCYRQHTEERKQCDTCSICKMKVVSNLDDHICAGNKNVKKSHNDENSVRSEEQNANSVHVTLDDKELTQQCYLCKSRVRYIKDHFKNRHKHHKIDESKFTLLKCKFCKYANIDYRALRFHNKTYHHPDGEREAAIIIGTESKKPVQACYLCNARVTYIRAHFRTSHYGHKIDISKYNMLKCQYCQYSNIDYDYLKKHLKSHQA